MKVFVLKEDNEAEFAEDFTEHTVGVFSSKEAAFEAAKITTKVTWKGLAEEAYVDENLLVHVKRIDEKKEELHFCFTLDEFELDRIEG